MSRLGDHRRDHAIWGGRDTKRSAHWRVAAKHHSAERMFSPFVTKSSKVRQDHAPLMAREAVDKHLEVAGAMVDPKSSITQIWHPRSHCSTAGGIPHAGSRVLHAQLPVPRPMGLSPRFIHCSAAKLARESSRHAGVPREDGTQASLLFRLVDVSTSCSPDCLHCSCDCTGEAQSTQRQRSGGTRDMFCNNSRRVVEDKFYALWHNDDDQKVAITKQVMGEELGDGRNGSTHRSLRARAGRGKALLGSLHPQTIVPLHRAAFFATPAEMPAMAAISRTCREHLGRSWPISSTRPIEYRNDRRALALPVNEILRDGSPRWAPPVWLMLHPTSEATMASVVGENLLIEAAFVGRRT